ncbi:MAG: DEAD/DEAH box helicase [Kiritimatiellae bacterium]|nr:DEAD/DEAH box helicase [Kiritimatiellia bacterium]
MLQIVWRQRAFWLWGETDSPPDDALSPFDIGASGLTAFFRAFPGANQTFPAPEPLVLYLPSPGGRPLSSISFLNPPDALSGSLRPWKWNAVKLEGKLLLFFLNRIHERRIRAETFAAPSLLAFAELLRFAGSLVARGRFLPDVSVTGDGDAALETAAAVWSPCLDRVDQKRFDSLVASFPPVCVEPHGASGHAVRAALTALLDSLVRASCVTKLTQAEYDHAQFYSSHDAWFAALRSATPAVRWTDLQGLHGLRDELAEWRRPVTFQEAGGLSLRFTLHAPETEEAPWPLVVGIVRGDTVEEFPQETARVSSPDLLLFLGQAAMLFPALAAAVPFTFAGRPVYGCRLTRDEAQFFLSGTADTLANAGFEVALPDILRDRRTSLEVVAGAESGAEDGTESLASSVRLRWSVSLDGEPVTEEELASMLLAESPLVFFRGRWIEVDLRQLQNALRISRRKTPENVSVREVVNLALNREGKSGFHVARVDATGWLDNFLHRLAGDEPFRVLAQPSSLLGTLRPYQVRGYSWLRFLRQWGFGACLADDMGLGKTIQTLAFLLGEKATGQKRPSLIVGPTSVLGNWMRETGRFAPSLRAFLHHGPERPHGAAFVKEAKGADVVFTSYALLHRDYADLRRVPWSGIVLDEAQNIKNPATRQSGCARALPADFRIALTGTPIENHVGDLWSIMDFLNPGLLGRRAVFRERFLLPIRTGSDPGARLRLRQAVAPFILRRLKTDQTIISDLPEKTEGKVYCPLTLEQSQLYRDVLDSFRRDLAVSGGISRRGLILAVLTHLKQICNHPSNYLGEDRAEPGRSGKLTRLTEMLEEIFEAGESALVFTQYAEMGRLLQRSLRRSFAVEMPFLHGGVPRRERDRMVESFQNASMPSAFILSLKAGGMGLNLTRATHVFHFDRWWNPAVENQATDRAFRIGQTNNVFVHKFICGGTLEDRIDRLIEEKTELAEAVIAHGEGGLTELSDTALQKLLELNQDLIEE